MTLKSKLWLPVSGLILLILIFWGCEDSQNNTPTSSGPITLSWVIPPQNLEATELTYTTIIGELTGVSGYDIDSVKAVISDESGAEVSQFHLYDDANAFEHDDALAYCSPFSGDIVAHDGKFTRQINSQFAEDVGNYDFTLHAWWNNSTKEIDPVTISIAESVPPVLSIGFFPMSLESGFDPIAINVEVIDPDTLIGDEVTDVFMKFYSPDSIELDSIGLNNVGGDLYGTTLTPDLNIGLPTDDYFFAFWAKDSYNNMSDSLGIEVEVENLAPFLDNLQYEHEVVLPDTYMYVPITIDCWDGQTVADVDSVNMLSLKPDSTYANDGNPIPLNDDGEFGDLVAGDSVFSINAILENTSLPGKYVFTFWARDLAGNKTADIIDSLIVTE